LAYGIEIKNTQNYIQHDELQIKLRLCQHLGLVLSVALNRTSAPKSYMFDIAVKNKGFGLLFEEQIYPWGHSSLLAEVRNQLGLKVQPHGTSRKATCSDWSTGSKKDSESLAILYSGRT